jgi:hypothetical protein
VAGDEGHGQPGNEEQQAAPAHENLPELRTYLRSIGLNTLQFNDFLVLPFLVYRSSAARRSSAGHQAGIRQNAGTIRE